MFEMISKFFASIGKEFGQTFRSLKNPAYRTYAIGHFISMIGSQLQAVALAWTTYSLTQSASKLGLTALATYLPALFLGMFGGLIADRFNRRRVLIGTQAAGLVLAMVLAALSFSGILSFELILLLGFLQGVVNAIELPCRQAFVFDVVGAENTVNAVGLNSTIFNSSRLIGPALAAVLLPLTGEAICFGLNSVSFLAAMITLAMLTTSTAARKKDGGPSSSLRAGVQLACGTPAIRNVLMLTAVTSFFVFQYSIMLPVVVATVLHGSAVELGIITSCAAVGSLVGNLLLASRGSKELLPRILSLSSLAPGVFLLIFALSTSFPVTAGSAALLGCAIALQLGSSNSFLQLTVPSEFRGRVMSMYTSLLMGSVPVGSLLVGYLADMSGAPMALMVCALSALAGAGLYVLATLRGNN